VPPRDWRIRFEDILDAIARIQSYTESLTVDAFLTDQKTQDAVIRNLEIIGECARLVDDETSLHRPPGWSRSGKGPPSHAGFPSDRHDDRIALH